MDILGHTTFRVLNQLTLDDLDWWHSVVFFFWKIISAETMYETHNNELLAIIKAFKTWKHYLKRSQHKVLILNKHNNLRRFI